MSKLLLFMTWDVSLQLWQEKGLYQREIKLYQELAKEGVDITFLSWGDEKDLELKPVGINVIPVYQYMWRPDDKFLRAMVSLFVPFVMWSKLSKFDPEEGKIILCAPCAKENNTGLLERMSRRFWQLGEFD